MRAAHPQMELTTTSVVPASFRWASTSSANGALDAEARPLQAHGVTKRSSYIGALERFLIGFVSWLLGTGNGEPGTDGSRSGPLVLHIAVADQRQDRALGDHQVRVSLERDLDGGLAKE